MKKQVKGFKDIINPSVLQATLLNHMLYLRVQVVKKSLYDLVNRVLLVQVKIQRQQKIKPVRNLTMLGIMRKARQLDHSQQSTGAIKLNGRLQVRY